MKRLGLLFLSLSLALFAAEATAPAPVATSKAEFVYPDFTQCYEKNRASIVYFGQTRAVAISEKLAVAYTKEKPTVPFIKHDYLLAVIHFYKLVIVSLVKCNSILI